MLELPSFFRFLSKLSCLFFSTFLVSFWGFSFSTSCYFKSCLKDENCVRCGPLLAIIWPTMGLYSHLNNDSCRECIDLAIPRDDKYGTLNMLQINTINTLMYARGSIDTISTQIYYTALFNCISNWKERKPLWLHFNHTYNSPTILICQDLAWYSCYFPRDFWHLNHIQEKFSGL